VTLRDSALSPRFILSDNAHAINNKSTDDQQNREARH
jgi:hypothetical protein